MLELPGNIRSKVLTNKAVNRMPCIGEIICYCRYLGLKTSRKNLNIVPCHYSAFLVQSVMLPRSVFHSIQRPSVPFFYSKGSQYSLLTFLKNISFLSSSFFSPPSLSFQATNHNPIRLDPLVPFPRLPSLGQQLGCSSCDFPPPGQGESRTRGNTSCTGNPDKSGGPTIDTATGCGSTASPGCGEIQFGDHGACRFGRARRQTPCFLERHDGSECWLCFLGKGEMVAEPERTMSSFKKDRY